jgi:hypothetical protein
VEEDLPVFFPSVAEEDALDWLWEDAVEEGRGDAARGGIGASSSG